jgi:hypothetical protein
MSLVKNPGQNQRPTSVGASQHPVTFSPNPPQSTVAAALAAGKKTSRRRREEVRAADVDPGGTGRLEDEQDRMTRAPVDFPLPQGKKADPLSWPGRKLIAV